MKWLTVQKVGLIHQSVLTRKKRGNRKEGDLAVRDHHLSVLTNPRLFLKYFSNVFITCISHELVSLLLTCTWLHISVTGGCWCWYFGEVGKKGPGSGWSSSVSVDKLDATLREHTENTQRTLRLHSKNTQRTLRAHSENTQSTLRANSRSIQMGWYCPSGYVYCLNQAGSLSHDTALYCSPPLTLVQLSISYFCSSNWCC